jgi:hypothetical protein
MLTATERKALTMSVFAGSCICFSPAEFVSGTVLLIVAAVLYFRFRRHDQLEAGAGGADEPPGPAAAP